MSAWIVCREHIDLMVRAALRSPQYEGQSFQWWRADERGDFLGWRKLSAMWEGTRTIERTSPDDVSPSELGAILLAENVRSVQYRYPDDGPGTLPGPTDAFYVVPYVYRDPQYTMTPGELFMSLDCFEYQACEHPDWRRSEAFRICDALRRAWTHHVPGYEDAPWGWDEDSLRKARDARDLSR